MAAEPLPLQRDDTGPCPGCVTVTLEQAGRPVVVLDHDLIRRLDAALEAVPKDATGLVLASASERSFVAGADLKSISEFSDERLRTYLEHAASVFSRLCGFRFPTVAAIGGAALGGGLELALHCDGLVGAPSENGKPYPIGLPEAGLGLCPGWGGTNTLPARIDPTQAIELTAVGKPMMFDEAREAGLFDAVATNRAELSGVAKAWLAGATKVDRDGAPRMWIGRPDRAPDVISAVDAASGGLPDTAAAQAVVRAVNTGLSSGWRAAIESEQTSLIRLRHTVESREAIKAFFERSRK